MRICQSHDCLFIKPRREATSRPDQRRTGVRGQARGAKLGRNPKLSSHPCGYKAKRSASATARPAPGTPNVDPDDEADVNEADLDPEPDDEPADLPLPPTATRRRGTWGVAKAAPTSAQAPTSGRCRSRR
jgi:hypothetical protein